MPNQSYYRGSAHRSRRAPQSDAIVVALTAQVLVCLILLLAAVIAKGADEPAYRTARAQYDELVSEPPDGQSAFAGVGDFGEALQDVFAGIEGWITSLIERFVGDPAASLPAEEPRDGPGIAGGDDADAAEAWEFDYDYLGQNQIVRAGFGMGGQYPVPAGEMPPAAPPPANATYAAVELAGNIRPPVTGPVTSPFAYREHPLSGEGDFHTGIDIAAPEGRAVLAVLPGVVSEVGESEIYGNFVVLAHSEGFETFYAHCSEIIAREGMRVRQGERIAKVGHTGVATGPHLHFSVLVNGQYTDPFWVLREHIHPVAQ